jgi:hypothetical protein
MVDLLIYMIDRVLRESEASGNFSRGPGLKVEPEEQNSPHFGSYFAILGLKI